MMAIKAISIVLSRLLQRKSRNPESLPKYRVTKNIDDASISKQYHLA
jgi:hypothetical protein